MDFSQLVDINELRELCLSFTAINGAVTAVLDLEGNVLVATGWQDICTQFHRTNPMTCARCRESDTILADRSNHGEPYNVYQCKNGMVDVAVPITIGGEHVANFFTGQFFLSPPDKDYFIRQAKEFGFDEVAYIGAMERAPVFSAEQVHSMMAFFTRLAKAMGEMGLSRLRLQEANTKLQVNAAIIQSSEDAIFGESLDGIIESWNPVAEKIFGYSSSEAIGKPLNILVPPDRAVSEVEIVSKIFHGERVSHFETIRRRKDGKSVNLSISISPILDGAGKVIGASTIARDITARKQAEEELLHYRTHLEEEVAQRTADLEVARREAEAANQAKSDFLANMSHEIRTPMNAILGMLYLALRSDMPPTLHRHLCKIQGAAKSLLVIINDILDLSKVEAGKLEIEAVEFSLDSVLEQLTDAIGVQAEKKNIEFLIRHDDKIPTCLIGDPLRLGQVLLNVCGNAIKFTEAGEVELSLQSVKATETELTLQFCVRDTGIGMTQELQERLFQKFTQADHSSTRRFGGTGLGLMISKHLTELMGGRIWVQNSEPGQGSTVCCTVQLKIERQAARTQVGPLLENIRVLVVDDNEASREILADILRALRIEVGMAANGQAAIEQLEQASAKPFDVVLMDWRMPGMNGDEATRRICAAHSIAHKPKVVMVTAYGREEVLKLAEQAGVDGFLVKPVLPSVLFDTLLTVLGRARVLRTERGITPLRGTPEFAGARLLLVEDNEINREFAVELLCSMQIQVDQAVDGEEAVAKVQARAYDGVLMDIQMPKLDGFEATRAIRRLSVAQDDRFASIPIIAMTAQALTGDRGKSIAAGMNDYLSKPINPELLAGALARWLKIPDERRQVAAKAAAPSPVRPTAALTGTTTEADLLALQSFDAAQGIYRIGGKAQAYRRQLSRFRDNYGDAAGQLQALIAEADLPAAQAYSHVLKGVCGTLSASALFACVTGLDDLLKQGEPPQAEQIESLRQLLRQAMNEIDDLSAAPPPPAPTAPIGRAELLSKLETLGWFLEHDLGAAEELLDELQAASADSGTETALREIAAQADLFAVDEALERIRALCTQLSMPKG